MDNSVFQRHLDAIKASDDIAILEYALKALIESEQSIVWRTQGKELADAIRHTANGLLYELRSDKTCDFSRPLWIREHDTIDDGAHHPIDPIKNRALFYRWHRFADATEWKSKTFIKKIHWPLLSSAIVFMMILFFSSFVMAMSVVFSSFLWIYGVAMAVIWFLVSCIWIYTKNRMVLDAWHQKLEGLSPKQKHDEIDHLELSHSGQRESMHKQPR